jgi:hypothetical protein
MLSLSVGRKDDMGKVISLPFSRIIEHAKPLERSMAEEYRHFLELKACAGDVWALLARMKNREQMAAIENLVDRVLQQQGDGSKDLEFRAWLGGPFTP